MIRKLILYSCILFAAFAAVVHAGYREDFEREFLTKPWAGEQVEESSCIGCHSFKPTADENVPVQWKMTVHYENNVSCHDCHGGDPKDASMAMSHQRGFIGVPKPADIPDLCGKCHIGILKHFLESGHGKALKASRNGPSCVTCHGSHKKGNYIQKAHIDIINEQLCSQCHSYDRAREMKQALFVVEKKIQEIEGGIDSLRKSGVFVDEEERTLFSTHAEFRALFHSVDVTLVKNNTDLFSQRLIVLEQKMRETFSELQFRRNFSAFLMLLFAGMGIILLLLPKPPKE